MQVTLPVNGCRDPLVSHSIVHEGRRSPDPLHLILSLILSSLACSPDPLQPGPTRGGRVPSRVRIANGRAGAAGAAGPYCCGLMAVAGCCRLLQQLVSTFDAASLLLPLPLCRYLLLPLLPTLPAVLC
jgi:hypothetical protein